MILKAKSAKTLKHCLAAHVAVSRFRQRLFSEDGSRIQDDDVFALAPAKIQLLLVEALLPDAEQREKTNLCSQGQRLQRA